MQSNMVEMRHALTGMISATASANSNKALAAREVATRAYRNSFDAGERERVVKLARQKQLDAPGGHFLKEEDPITSYEGALEIFGNSILYEALGQDA